MSVLELNHCQANHEPDFCHLISVTSGLFFLIFLTDLETCQCVLRTVNKSTFCGTRFPHPREPPRTPLARGLPGLIMGFATLHRRCIWAYKTDRECVCPQFFAAALIPRSYWAVGLLLDRSCWEARFFLRLLSSDSSLGSVLGIGVSLAVLGY